MVGQLRVDRAGKLLYQIAGAPAGAEPLHIATGKPVRDAVRAVVSGVWRMEDDCLRLELSAGVGTSLSGSFPILVSPSGEEMHFQRSRSGEGVPFLSDDMDSIELMRSYG